MRKIKYKNKSQKKEQKIDIKIYLRIKFLKIIIVRLD